MRLVISPAAWNCAEALTVIGFSGLTGPSPSLGAWGPSTSNTRKRADADGATDTGGLPFSNHQCYTVSPSMLVVE